MRKLIALLLALCVLSGLLTAFAEGDADQEAEGDRFEDWDPPKDEPAGGMKFDFILRLHPENLSGELGEKAKGYAELLNALRFHGTYAQSLESDVFDLSLSVIPVDSRAEPITLRVHGVQDLMYLDSSLFGDNCSVALANQSLLNFCSKMSEHLGIPLQYPALLLPYTWLFHLALPIRDWNGMVESMDENGVISKEAVHFLWDCWNYRLDNYDPLQILESALTKDSDMEEAFRGVVTEAPVYFEKTVAQEQEIHVLREGDTEIWRAASGDFYRETNTDTRRIMDLNLPRMQCGYQPVFCLETIHEENRQSGRVRFQLLNTDGMQEDLLNLEASYTSFPETWPVNAQSLFGVSLTGGLLPNIGFSVYLATEDNGHVRAEVRKPTVDYEPGAVMLTIEGDMTPLAADATIKEFTLLDLQGALDLLEANDGTIRDYLPGMLRPMLTGILRFLVGIPTSACQTIMDDMENLGVVNLLLGE